MADITNPSAIEFTNQIRECADALNRAYWLCKRLERDWFARGMGSIITNTSDPIVDGSTKPLTGADATNVITQAMSMNTTYDASSYAVLNIILKATSTGE